MQGLFVEAFEKIENAPQVAGHFVSSYETQLIKEADELFYAGMDNDDNNLKESYLINALGKFMLLLKMHPDNPVFCTKIAVIHETCHHCPQAKDYFHRAINLENLNPFANFYFGEYYFIQRDYNNAIRHYLIAYHNGYRENLTLNLRIATVYDRLGDIEKAKKYYYMSEKLSADNDVLASKIKTLDDSYYTLENYTERTIRE